jgi:hypothetical protein
MKRSISEFLREDRQWIRPQRIQHAEMQLKQSQEEADRKFWLAILAANGVIIKRDKRGKERVHYS